MSELIHADDRLCLNRLQDHTHTKESHIPLPSVKTASKATQLFACNPHEVLSLVDRLNQLSVLQEAGVDLKTRRGALVFGSRADWQCPEHEGPRSLTNIYYNFIHDVVSNPPDQLTVSADSLRHPASWNAGYNSERPASLPRRRRGSLNAASDKQASSKPDSDDPHSLASMDPAQISNRNAAAQYLATIDQARTPEMAVKVVKDALADKDMYSFAELFAKKQVQDLGSTDAKIWVELLKIFMWGTYGDYEQLPNKPLLDDAQQLKLRQLTLVTLASNTAPTITKKTDQKLYIPNVQEALYLKSSDEVGPIFIKAVEHKLFDGSVDNAKNMLEIKAIYPSRDLSPSEINEMNSLLGKWVSAADQELKLLNKNMDVIRAEARDRRENEAADAEKFEAAIIDSNKNNRKRGGASGNEGMDSGAGSSRNTRQR